MKHRASVRGFDLARIERILRNSSERYVDTVTGRLVAVGRHDTLLVMIPYEVDEGIFTPITIHATTRQQINSRLKSGRFTYE
jgi:hypothetical protein